VQQLCGASFPSSDEFRSEDQRNLLYERTILRGEAVRAEWAGVTAPLPAPAVDNLLSQIEQH
jgi:hypothetical protein